jgi:hypothetical protein
MKRPTEVERAYQMARSGAFATTEEIMTALRAEGYDGNQLLPPAFQLRTDLRFLINASRRTRKEGPDDGRE